MRPTSRDTAPPCLRLSDAQRALLEKWANSHRLEARVVRRSRIVLWLAASGSIAQVAAALGVARGTVRLWKARFDAAGPEALRRDAPGRGRKPALGPAARQRVRAEFERGTISCRRLARELGVSSSTISRWRKRIGAHDTQDRPLHNIEA